MSRNFKWGILSTGKIAHKFTQDLQLVEDAQIVAVGSRSAAKAEDFAHTYGIPNAYGDYETLFNDDNIDIIYVASPHSHHYVYTMRALECEKHVLCEKPIAMNAVLAKRMYKKAESNHLLLQEALWTAHLPHYLKALEHVQNKMIGSIQLLTGDFSFPAVYDENSRLFALELGGGALLDVGIYPVMMALSILGPPAKISAHMIKGETGVDLSTGILITHKNGTISSLSCSLLQNGRRSLEILGTKGRLTLGPQFWKPSQLLHHTGDNINDLTPEMYGIGYHYQVRTMHETLLNKELENKYCTRAQSMLLIETLDEIRNVLGLHYV